MKTDVGYQDQCRQQIPIHLYMHPDDRLEQRLVRQEHSASAAFRVGRRHHL